MSEVPLPTLPPYQPPAQREPAVLPPALVNPMKPHGIINKMVGKMLAKKQPKISSKRPTKVVSRRKKYKVL